MIPEFEQIYLALPEIILLVGVVLALLSQIFWVSCKKATYIITQGNVFFAALCSGFAIHQPTALLFHGFFLQDDMAAIMKLFICISVFLSFFYARSYLQDRKMPEGDYYILGLFSTLGMLVLVSGHSLLTLYLGVELLSLPLYALVAIRRKEGNASEAAMKYFVMGAIASGMLLYGMSLLYGATGDLDLAKIAIAVKTHWQAEPLLFSFALVFLLAGVGFKLAVAPFHMWAPDVYQGASTSVTLFISAAPKIAALGFAFRICTLGFADMVFQWQQMLLVLCLLSVGLGNILAVVQENIKRLFAYSAISHAGYALFGLLAATTAGYAASLYYIIIYALMSLAGFGLLVLLSRANLEVEKIEDLQGLHQRNPWLAFLMMIVLFSMAGVPPTVGFFTKLLVLKALVEAKMLAVAILGLLFAVVGAYYYIKVIKVMYFEKPRDSEPLKLSSSSTWVFSVHCLSLLYFGIFPSSLIVMCSNAFIS